MAVRDIDEQQEHRAIDRTIELASKDNTEPRRAIVIECNDGINHWPMQRFLLGITVEPDRMTLHYHGIGHFVAHGRDFQALAQRIANGEVERIGPTETITPGAAVITRIDGPPLPLWLRPPTTKK